MLVDSARLTVGLSIGVAAFPEHSLSKHDLISQAAAALEEARASGGGTARCSGLIEAESLGIGGETFTVLQGLVRAIDAKDHYTQEHSNVVTDAAVMLAQRLNLPETALQALRIAGLLHDVGKIGIPDGVLKKPGKLTRDEYEIMKQHVVLSETIIRGVPQPEGVLDAVSHHHERYDGQGYPYGKAHDEIPLLGRIMGIADAYSAMCMNRPYRKGMSWSEVRAELEKGAGTQFDPFLVQMFIEAMEELRGIDARPERIA
jgi:putative nucleotidyltransferase with HDIG domain